MQDKSARFYTLLSVGAAALTITLKAGAYFLTGSVGLLSDAAESCVNLVAAIVATWAVTFAAKPPDEEHEFGHYKAEYFSSGVEGALILVAAGSIAIAAWNRLLHPQPLEPIRKVIRNLLVSYGALKLTSACGGNSTRNRAEHRPLKGSLAALNEKSPPLGSKPSSMTNKPSEFPTLWRVPDPLWAQIAPTLVVNKPRQKPGRHRAADRPIFDALIYLARTGMQWAVLPKEFPPKSTVHDRLQEWVEYGCLEAAWALLLADYDETLGIEWQWQAADGCIVKAPLGKRTAEGVAQATGANPTDRSKSGCKRHLLTDGKGIPLAVVLSGANRHDMKKLADLLDAKVLEAPAPETIEQHLCLDRGYDYQASRQAAQQRGYIPHIPDKEAPLPAPTDTHRHPPRRWVVEVGHAWFNRFRGVLIRWAKSSQSYLGFVQIAACLIVGRKLLSFSG